MNAIVYKNFKLFEDPVATGTIASSVPGTGGQLIQDNFKFVADNFAPSGITELVYNKNQPNGYPGLNGNGDLVGRIIVRYDTASNLSSQVLSGGELAITSDTNSLLLGDGTTIGGIPATKAKVTTIIKTSSDSSSFYIDHQNADIVVIQCHLSDVSKAFTVDATTSGDSLPTPGSEGIKSGSYVGQRLIIQFDLQASTSDGLTGSVINVSLNGKRFGWNSDNNFYFSGITSLKRLFGTEPNIDGLIGTFRCGQSIQLTWDGTYWQETTDYRSTSIHTDSFGFSAGAYNRSGTYGIAVGRKLNRTSTPQFSAVFGDDNDCNANYCLVGGSTSKPGSGNTYSIVWGSNISNVSSFVGGVGNYIALGDGIKPRMPYSRTWGSANGTVDWGAWQAADYIFFGQTTSSTPTVLNCKSNALTIPAKTAIQFMYQLVAYNVTDNTPWSVAGFGTIWRDGSNTTAMTSTVNEVHNQGTVGTQAYSITADDTNEQLKITVTGISSKTIRWMVRLTACEVAGGAT